MDGSQKLIPDVFFFSHFSTLFSEIGPLTEPAAHYFILTGWQWGPGKLCWLCLTPLGLLTDMAPYPVFTWVLEIQKQVLLLAPQALYPTSHFPRPHKCTHLKTISFFSHSFIEFFCRSLGWIQGLMNARQEVNYLAIFPAMEDQYLTKMPRPFKEERTGLAGKYISLWSPHITDT